MPDASTQCQRMFFWYCAFLFINAGQVFLKGKELAFTKKEVDILLCLASHPGRVFTKDQLYDYAWEDKIIYNVESVIKTHISSLRQNMSEADIEYIRNVWGIGYRFQYEG